MANVESPCPTSKQIEVTVCHICGREVQSHHEVNYQKQVDPPANPYTQILPDWRYDIDEKKTKSGSPGQTHSIKVCIPIPVVGNMSQTNLNPTEEMATPCQPGTESDTKMTQTSKTCVSTAMKSSCFPTGGQGGSPPPVKMMLCLPCPPPDASKMPGGMSAPCTRNKPTDYTYRCESRELRGGILYTCCQCIKRNGLQHDCPRTPCQGRPACLVKPWPDCWPSGGCHGIDYTRERGFKRIDPCRDQRFDKKECRSPGTAPKVDCGGNMMLVVCPPPNQ